MTLIKDISTLRTVLTGVSANASFDNDYKSYIEDAETIYLIPVIGQEMYDAIEPADLTDDLLTAQQKIQKALAYYVMYDMVDFTNVNFTPTGAKETTGENQTQARQWVVKDAKASAIKKADHLLDLALEYMEANKASFGAWAGSDAYTEFKEYFITTTAEFNKEVPIQNSRRTFLRLKSHLESVELDHIKTAIGETLFDNLKTQLRDGTVTAPNEIILRKIRKATANLTMVTGAVDMPMNFDGSGIKVVSTSDGITTSAAVMDAQLGKYVQLRKSRGEGALADLKKYLIDNAATYPDFEGSDAETNGSPEIKIHDNSNKKSFMV